MNKYNNNVFFFFCFFFFCCCCCFFLSLINLILNSPIYPSDVGDNLRHLLPIVCVADGVCSTSKRVRYLNDLAKVGEYNVCVCVCM